MWQWYLGYKHGLGPQEALLWRTLETLPVNSKLHARSHCNRIISQQHLVTSKIFSSRYHIWSLFLVTDSEANVWDPSQTYTWTNLGVRYNSSRLAISEMDPHWRPTMWLKQQPPLTLPPHRLSNLAQSYVTIARWPDRWFQPLVTLNGDCCWDTLDFGT